MAYILFGLVAFAALALKFFRAAAQLRDNPLSDLADRLEAQGEAGSFHNSTLFRDRN